jgi:hypothetical protein
MVAPGRGIGRLEPRWRGLRATGGGRAPRTFIAMVAMVSAIIDGGPGRGIGRLGPRWFGVRAPLDPVIAMVSAIIDGGAGSRHRPAGLGLRAAGALRGPSSRWSSDASMSGRPRLDGGQACAASLDRGDRSMPISAIRRGRRSWLACRSMAAPGWDRDGSACLWRARSATLSSRPSQQSWMAAQVAPRIRSGQACPASLDSSDRSTPSLAIARCHLVSLSRPNTSSWSAGTISQPFAWISASSWPAPQPA